MYDLLLIASTLFFVAACTVFARHKAASIYHPAAFYLLFHGFLFVFRPIVARIYDFRFVYMVFEFQPSMADKMTVILGANLGLVVFLFVSLRIGDTRLEPALAGRAAIPRESLWRAFIIAATILTPLGLASVLSRWTAIASGDPTETIDPTTFVKIHTDSVGYFVEAQLVLAPLAVLFAWLTRFKWWSFIPLVVFVIMRAGTGGRGPFVYAITALLLLWLWDKRRSWPDARTVALVAMTGLAFAVVVTDRGRGIREVFIEDNSVAWEQAYDYAPLENMDYANLEYFEYLVYVVPQRSGTYDYFASYLQFFTEPIPRALWEGKPAGAPVRFMNLFDYGRPMGMTPSLPGAGWFELGWLGIVIQTAIFAAFYSYFYRLAARRGSSRLLVLFYFLLLATTVISYRDGSLISVARMSVFYQLPLLLIWLFTLMDRRGSLPADAFAGPQPDPSQRRKELAAQAAKARKPA